MLLHTGRLFVSNTLKLLVATPKKAIAASSSSTLKKVTSTPTPGRDVIEVSATTGESESADPVASKESSVSLKARKIAGKLRFDAYKAGLQKVDQAYVEQVIQEASKDTAFYRKEQRREEARRLKVDAILKKVEEYRNLSSAQKQALRTYVDTLEAEMEATRDLRRSYIHIDMDMFYAAVEEKKDPQLREVPFGVGSLQMLSTTNYIARQYGVRSGMPGFIGRHLCPDLLIVKNDFAAYRREAAIVHAIASRYDPHFVSVGLDELTMDVTKYLGGFSGLTAAQIVSDFRDEVYAKTQLTCSGGIAPTPCLAKIASNVNKPNGQHEIVLRSREEVLDYVKGIPLRKVPGIGYAQEMTLNALNVKTCGDLLKHKYLLAFLFKEKTFGHYLSVGLGLMSAQTHKKHEVRQSIGKEVSFSEPLTSPEAFAKLFRSLLETCHVQCVQKQLYPQQIRLVLKYRTYDNQQFSTPLPKHTNDLKLWLEAGKKLLQPHLSHFSELRLVGVRLQKLASEEGPPSGKGGSNHNNTLGASQAEEEIDNHNDAGEEEMDEEEHHRARDVERAEEVEHKAVGNARKKGRGPATHSKKSSRVVASKSEKPLKRGARARAKIPKKAVKSTTITPKKKRR
ncbi:unnamed protein product [Phytomonas sp. EM1]|nr:unnamed protein product [Phytomonas sp. EM1]|eukprot:CCW62340.1 unnamed protein product [Phytomonas sp. isolate EM1]